MSSVFWFYQVSGTIFFKETNTHPDLLVVSAKKIIRLKNGVWGFAIRGGSGHFNPDDLHISLKEAFGKLRLWQLLLDIFFIRWWKSFIYVRFVYNLRFSSLYTQMHADGAFKTRSRRFAQIYIIFGLHTGFMIDVNTICRSNVLKLLIKKSSIMSLDYAKAKILIFFITVWSGFLPSLQIHFSGAKISLCFFCYT